MQAIKNLYISAVTLTLVLTLSACGGGDGQDGLDQNEREAKSLFIIVDGISADVLEMIDTPSLDAIARQGSYARSYIGGEKGGYSESPTVSAVGYNHLLTGVWSNKHNVWNNDIDEPNYNYWNIFRLLKHNDPEKRVAVYSSWLDNRTKLLGDGLPGGGNLSIDIHYDGFEHDTLAFPHDEDGLYVQDIDQHVSESAALSIREEAPDLSWVYLWYPDSAGHNYGDGDLYYESLRVADRQIGKILEAVEYRQENHNEEWLLVVTTDHGRRLPDGRHHGGHSERERTIWTITNHPSANTYFAASKPGVVDIYPSIARFMDLEIPEDLAYELDGVPFIGDVSVSHPEAELDETSGNLHVSWKAWDEKGDVNLWISHTDNFSEGGEDHYELLGTAALIDQEMVLDVGDFSGDFMKIVIEGSDNTVNRWVIADE